MKATLVEPFVRVAFQAKAVGMENVPDEGGVVLASNHLHALDSLVIPALLSRRMTFPAKAELFAAKGFGNRLLAWFLRSIGILPMERGGGRASAESLGAISEVLGKGAVVGIYPEGTRSPDGRLYKGKTGMARMVLANDVPVLPVGVVGTDVKRGPFGIPWLWRPTLVIGQPMSFAQFQERRGEMKVLRLVTDEVMAAIQELTGQDYVDVYASRVKHGDLKDADTSRYELARPPAAGQVP